MSFLTFLGFGPLVGLLAILLYVGELTIITSTVLAITASYMVFYLVVIYKVNILHDLINSRVSELLTQTERAAALAGRFAEQADQRLRDEETEKREHDKMTRD